VDIAEEFSELIVSQRAFSMNSRLITTVDEMTENLVQLKR
jgi:flagellar hook protein FlgE